MILAFMGISFILGVILGCLLTLPIVMQIIKVVNKNHYDMGVQDTLERFKSGNNKKAH